MNIKKQNKKNNKKKISRYSHVCFLKVLEPEQLSFTYKVCTNYILINDITCLFKYSPFHNSLMLFSIQYHWLTTRNDETGWRWKLEIGSYAKRSWYAAINSLLLLCWPLKFSTCHPHILSASFKIKKELNLYFSD